MNVRHWKILLTLFVFTVGIQPLSGQSSTPQRLPIIDMHIHAFGWDHQGNPPPPNKWTGAIPAARPDEPAMNATLAEQKRFHIVEAVAGGPRETGLCWIGDIPV